MGVRGPCIVDDCVKDAWSRGLCGMHYQRWRKYADVTIDKPPQIERASTQCLVIDCDQGAVCRGWCQRHYSRWLRQGDPEALPPRHNWTGEAATYRAVHKRLATRRGKADRFICVDCGGQAHQWSYQGGDPDERQSSAGLAYTPNLDAYAPRCVSCHKRRDDPNPVGLKYRWPNRMTG